MRWHTQYASKFGKLSRDHRTGKGQFSFQSQRKAMPKNVQTTAQLHSTNTPAKWCSKFSKPGFTVREPRTSRCSPGLRKGGGTRDQIANICWIMEKAREFKKKHIFLLYWLCQCLWLCGSQNAVENSSRDGNTRPPDLPPEKSVCRSGSNS